MALVHAEVRTISRREGDDWTTPLNLGPEINTDEHEYGPTLSADGDWIYFTSHRGGTGNVYRVPLSVVREAMEGGERP